MKSLGVVLCLMAAWVLDANAAGFNLTWGPGCWRDNPATLETFSCGSNTGSFTMTASFMLDRPTQLGGFDVVLDLQSDSDNLPDWWQLTPSSGACRSGSLSTIADFSSAPGGCTYAWPGGPAGATFAIWRTALFPGYSPVPAPNRARYLGFYNGWQVVTVQAGVEYYAFSLTIDAQRTIGPGACGGCSTPATIVLNEIDLGSPYTKITTPLDNACLRWQASGVTPCSATPVRNQTWGAVKSLYR